MTRVFLSIIGVLYVALAAWCAARPAATARTVGFTLSPGSGQSEYLVVYGGLQLALGLIFLLPLARPGYAPFALTVCVLVHGCLVAFRLVSFLCYAGIERTTYVLAALEGLIVIGAAVLWFRR